MFWVSISVASELFQNDQSQSSGGLLPCCYKCGVRVLLSLIWYHLMSRSSTKVERQPKLFFVSTSSTTSTLQTASVCYATSGTPSGTCTGRRKRSIKIDGVPLADVKPSQLNQEVQSSQEAKLDREGRFLLYWITTTSISTSTSFTTTISISGKIVCTASGSAVKICG